MTLADFQTQIKNHGFDAYILTRRNMFLSQDVLAEENKILELTGFSGSIGTLLVFHDKSYLFVDGRYTLQAAKEVDTNHITVITTNGESLATWIQNNLSGSLKIAYNSWCHSISEVDYWNRAIKQHCFIEDNSSLAGAILTNRQAEIFEHDIEFSGVSMEEKISYLTDFMAQNKLEAYFMTECDAISWLLNLRSDCLPDTPLIRAFALIDKSGEVSLFTNDFNKIETELARYQGKTIGIAYNQTPKKLQIIMKNHKIWLENLNNPVQNWKSIKNPIEIQGIKNAHHRDAQAIIKFLIWLEKNWKGCDELSLVDKLHEFRSSGQHFYSNSFETIAAFAENGAIVHYQPTSITNKKLISGSVLLLDSGAQYFDGTTDITRTIAIDSATPEMIDSFTQVLKAHIALSSAYFPQGTTGVALDAIARSQLWQFGKNYSHGTGHGVGCFLNVHEGPQNISSRGASAPFQAGMITSIEPGYYKENAYGIRIENLALTITSDNPDFETPMLKFEPLTLVPIDKRLINRYLLNKREINWLNNYHSFVFQELSKDLDENERLWLKDACSPL